VTNRRAFLEWLAGLPVLGRHVMVLPGAEHAGRAPVTIEAVPTALYRPPDGRHNLVRIQVTGLDAPAARARVTDRRGTLVGTAGLLPGADPSVLAGEVWVPLAGPTEVQIELEVAKARVANRRVHLIPPRRWTLYVALSSHTDLGRTDRQERCLEIHRENLDAALAWLPAHPQFRWTAECALQVISYIENRAPAAGDALVQAIREGKLGLSAPFANALTGLLDHETLARLAWPAGLLARERGFGLLTALVTDVPGQTLTFPTLLAASGVRYLATGVNPERAVPLLSARDTAAIPLSGEGTAYPQLYWWEGPDGSRVLHWRGYGYSDGPRFGFDQGPEEIALRLSNWLFAHPVLLGPDYPYDVALLVGVAGDNGTMSDRLIANVEEFNRRYAFPRLVPARLEEFFRDVEERWGSRLPVRRGDTGLYHEDGAASTAAELAHYRAAQLTARAAELLALWDPKTEPAALAAGDPIRQRAAERRRMWRDLLLFGEHTWGSKDSVADPDGAETVAQWEYKRRFLDGAEAAADAQVRVALLQIGRASDAGTGRVVFNASSWPRSDVVRVPDGAGTRLSANGREWPVVDLADGSALVVARDVPALGYVALTESSRPPHPPASEGTALDARAGRFRVALDPATGAVRSLIGDDGRERVRTDAWPGVNQLVYVKGGEHSALWTQPGRDQLRVAPELVLSGAELVEASRDRLPGVGVRLRIERKLAGCTKATSVVTLYDELPWVDIENRVTKPATLEKEALYVAFPFALTHPTVEVEVPLGRMTVERDQQPGSCRDWFCHTHWVALRDATDGILWSGPDTPLFTLNEPFRGQWRRTLAPDGTLFAYVLHNYWSTNFAARQGGDFVFRFRISVLGPGTDRAEPVRRGWAACDPLYVSARYTNASAGPLKGQDAALVVADDGVAVVGAKPADDGTGAIVKLLDVAGVPRAVSVAPAAYGFRAARRANFVEMTGDAIPVGADGRATVPLPAWGTTALRLFTPREGAD
jgi:alpha-mannosidase